MNLVALFDIVAFVGFAGTVVVAVVYSRLTPKRMNRTAALLIILAMASAAFMMFSNTLEHLGITAQLAWVEDLVGIAFFPMLGYAYYLIWMDQEMEKLRNTTRAARAEHEMLMDVMDVTPAAIVLVDGSGRITFANEYARTVLELPTDSGGSYYATGGAIVPQGAYAALPSGVAFDPSILGRSFQAEPWEYVVGSVRTPLGLSAAPLAGARAGGSVVVFLPTGIMQGYLGGAHAHGS